MERKETIQEIIDTEITYGTDLNIIRVVSAGHEVDVNYYSLAMVIGRKRVVSLYGSD